MKAEIKTKVADLERLGVRARTIMAQFPQGLPAEQDQEVSKILSMAETLRSEIKTANDLEQKMADIDNLDRFLNEPTNRVPHGVNPDDESRKALLSAGWEIKSGMVCKMTSLGILQPMYAEDVLFGDMPTKDATQAEFYKTTRAGMSTDYKSAYAHYIKSIARSPGGDGMAWNMLTDMEQKALSEGTDTAGGFLVPPDIQAELLVRTAQKAVIRSRARVQPTSRDTLEWPAVAANTTSGFTSIYSSGFVGGWVGETPAFSDTDPKFQMFKVPIKKLRVATKLSNDFVADAASNVLAFLAANGSENMALVEDYGFIQGDGGPLQPMGILNSGITTFDVEGSTSNLVLNTTSATGSAPKIITGAYKLPAQYVQGATWLMCRDIEGKVRSLVDASGRPLWPPQTGSGFAAAPRDLVGFGVVNTDFMPTDGTDKNQVLLLGDLSNYIIGQRAQITSVVLRERFADSDQVGIILFERVGGGVFNTDAFRVGIV